jgi:hypothetical protein
MSNSAPQLRGGSAAAVVAGAVVLGMDVVYVLVLRSEGEGDLNRTRPQLIAASLAAAGAVALGGWLVREPRLRLALLSAAAFTLLGWGFLGMFSIGAPVFAAGVLLLFPTGRAADGVSGSEAFAITAAAGISALALIGVILGTTG